MDIREFAEKHSLAIRKDSCGDPIIAGWSFVKSSDPDSDEKRRPEHKAHIFDAEDGRHLGVCLSYPYIGEWTKAKNALREAGFILKQDAETEGTLRFNPTDDRHAFLAVTTCLIPRVTLPEAA